MPAPCLTWNPDEAAQNAARAADLDRACKDAVAKDRERIAAAARRILSPGAARVRMLDAICSGEPAPEGK